MKKLLMALGFVATALLSTVSSADEGVCTGKFPNLISDVCWSCMFPIKLFGSTELISDGQEDFDSGNKSAFCTCDNPPKVGIPASFRPVSGYMWPYEPAAQKIVDSGKPAAAATASADMAPIASMLPNGNAYGVRMPASSSSLWVGSAKDIQGTSIPRLSMQVSSRMAPITYMAGLM